MEQGIRLGFVKTLEFRGEGFWTSLNPPRYATGTEPNKTRMIPRKFLTAVSVLRDQFSGVHSSLNPWLYVVVTELGITCLNTQFRKTKKKKYWRNCRYGCVAWKLCIRVYGISHSTSNGRYWTVHAAVLTTNYTYNCTIWKPLVNTAV
jgi:hypothetical protein